MPLVSRTRATLRSAEFGFFGVVVYTRVHTPRRCGEPLSAGALVFSTLSSRPLRTSWLIVGMGGLDLLPALGRAVDVVRCWCVPGRPARPILAVDHRPAPAFGRVALRENRPADRAGLVAPRDSARPHHLAVAPSVTDVAPGTRPVGRTSGHPGAPRTGAGPDHPGHS